MFVGLQAINVADNIIKAGDGAGDGHCAHIYFIGDLNNRTRHFLNKGQGWKII